MSATAPGAYAFSAFALPPLITAIVTIAFGLRVLLRSPTRVSRAFAAMAAAVAVWMLAFTMVYLSRTPSAARFWVTIAYLGVPFIAPASYHFAVELLRIYPQRRIAVWAAWAGAAISFLLVATSDLIVGGVTRYSFGFYPRYALPNGIPFLLFFFCFLVAALVELLNALRHARGLERTRLRSVAIGIAVAYLSCVDFLPKYGLEIYPFGYLPILAFMAIVAHTVRRYELAAITPQFAAREIIGTMADPLFVSDADGVVRLANPAAATLLGYEHAEIVGQPLGRFV